jgi:hypothetical protein
MNNRWRVGCLVASMLAVGFAPAKAQTPMPAPRTFHGLSGRYGIFNRRHGDHQ